MGGYGMGMGMMGGYGMGMGMMGMGYGKVRFSLWNRSLY